MSDINEMVNSCKQGDRSAQRFIYEHFGPKMRALCFRYTRDHQNVEDIFHDAFVWIFTHIDQYKGTGSFEGWIRRIFIGTAIKYLKNKKGFGLAVSEEDLIQLEGKHNVAESDWIEKLEDVEVSEEQVLEMMQDLPDGYRIVFNLYVFEKYSHKEIASLLDITVGTSKSQLNKARKALQNHLFDYWKTRSCTSEKEAFKNSLRIVI